MTPVVEVKSAEDKQAKLIEVSKSIDNVIKSLTIGEYSDERGYALEMRLKWLQNQFVILSTSEPFDKNEHLDKKEPSSEFDWGQVVKQFTNK
jgi:hypothetical protein